MGAGHDQAKNRESDLQIPSADLNAAATLRELTQLIGTLPEGDRTLAVAQAINLNAQKNFDAERSLYLERLERTRDIHAQIKGFATAVGENPIDQETAFKSLALTFNPVKASERQEHYQQGRVTALFDELFGQFAKKLSYIVGTQHASQLYAKKTDPLCREASQELPLIERAKLLEQIKEHQRGFLQFVEGIDNLIKGFPNFSRRVADRLRNAHKNLMLTYGRENPDKQDGPSSMFDLMDRGPQRAYVPLYKDNIYLTAFLHDLVERLPVGIKRETESGDKDGKKKTPRKLLRDPEVAEFITYLKSQSDPVIYAAINSQKVWEGVSRCLTEFSKGLHGFYLTIKSSGLDELRKGGKFNIQAAYDNIVPDIENTMRGERGGLEGLESFREFRLAEVTELIESFESAPADSKAAKAAAPKKPLSRKEKSYLKLFEQVDTLVREIITGEAGNPELEKAMQSILPLKDELAGQRNVSTDQLEVDIVRDNYAFDVVQGGFGELELVRIPTHAVSYDDIKGESWDDVRAALDTLRDYAQISEFYRDMTIRGATNNNLLLVGPYGCGKNMFLKALMSDPTITGINMTSDRVLSMWHSKSEQNTRAIFQMAEQKRFELDRPSFIGWDEFDSLFPHKDGSGMSSTSDIMVRVQKVLQSVLCGDTSYDGVALIALSNEPEQIPMAIWRRFAQVVVIQPLTGDERRDMMMHMLSGLPLTDKFSEEVHWDIFEKKTEDASGDVLGKIFDQVYRDVREFIYDNTTGGMNEIVAAVREAKGEGRPMTQELRRSIFEKVTEGKMNISGDTFMRAMLKVLEKKDIVQAMRRQSRFYHEIDRRFDDAALND